MAIRTPLYCLFFLGFFEIASAQHQSIETSMQKIRLSFSLDDTGIPTYKVFFDNFPDPNQKYAAIIYKDGDNADRKNNPESYVIGKMVVDQNTKLNIILAAGGGAAISIYPNK